MPSEVRILPSPPDQPAADRLKHSSFTFSSRGRFRIMRGITCWFGSGTKMGRLQRFGRGCNLSEMKRFNGLHSFLCTGGSSSVGRASAFQAEGRGFDPRFPLHFLKTPLWMRIATHSANLSRLIWQVFSFFFAHVAQSVEHFLGKEEVIGSIPIVGSR